MPDTPLGHELAAVVPDPPVTIDATKVLDRARRRAGLRTTTLAATAAVAVGWFAVLVTAFQPSTSHVSPVTSKRPNPAPSAAATPTPPPAPNVIGLSIDAAMTAAQSAGCGVGVGTIINGAAPVGAVLSQRTSSDPCELSLTISAGPRTSAAPCTALTVTAGGVGAGLGHAGFPLHFRNTGQAACSLTGYPTVSATDSRSGRKVTARQTPSGYLGGTNLPVPTYLLAPGEQVSALVEGTDNPVGNATSCSELQQMRVTISDRSIPVAGSLSNCSGMEVHPYVPGTTGRA